MNIVTKCAVAGGLLFLAACDGIAVANAPVDEMVVADPTFASPSQIAGITPDVLPQVVMTGPAIDMDWNLRYGAGVAYVNTTQRPITVYSGPDAQNAIARLSPGNGGAIDACAVEVEMCSISFGSNRARGWVFMENMGLVAES